MIFNRVLHDFMTVLFLKKNTVRLGFKEQLNKEQLDKSKLFLVTNMPVHFINGEQIGFSEQFWDDQKVPKRPCCVFFFWIVAKLTSKQRNLLKKKRILSLWCLFIFSHSLYIPPFVSIWFRLKLIRRNKSFFTKIFSGFSWRN